MLKKHIESKLAAYFEHDFTPSQQHLLSGLSDFLVTEKREPVLLIKVLQEQEKLQ